MVDECMGLEHLARIGEELKLEPVLHSLLVDSVKGEQYNLKI